MIDDSPCTCPKAAIHRHGSTLWMYDKPFGTPPDCPIHPAPTPPPGSPAAIDQGCTCAVLDNHGGAGVLIGGTRMWWTSIDCPLHKAEAKNK